MRARSVSRTTGRDSPHATCEHARVSRHALPPGSGWAARMCRPVGPACGIGPARWRGTMGRGGGGGCGRAVVRRAAHVCAAGFASRSRRGGAVPPARRDSFPSRRWRRARAVRPMCLPPAVRNDRGGTSRSRRTCGLAAAFAAVNGPSSGPPAGTLPAPPAGGVAVGMRAAIAGWECELDSKGAHV